MGVFGRQGVIKFVYVNHVEIRRAASDASEAAQSVSVDLIPQAASAVAEAVPASQSAAAFIEIADALEPRLLAFRGAVIGWADEVHAAVEAYEATDELTVARLTRNRWQVV